MRQQGTLAGRALAAVLALSALAPARAPAVTASAAGAPAVTVTENIPLRPVPPAYLGFSIDPANLCYVVQLAQTDPAFAQLFRTIDPGGGVFRVGGNTGDAKASWSTTAAAPSCAWNKLVMTPSLVQSFFAFAASVGYKVMWQVPLNNGQPAADAAEAAYVSAMPGLMSIEIGNEPNYYAGAAGKVAAIIADWQAVRTDYLADGGTAPLTGSAASVGATWWSTPFMDAAAPDLAAMTGHWYVASATSNPTCTTLLAAPGATVMAAAVARAASFGLPFIMNETNTYKSQGMPGVSNAYCSALWAASYSLNGLAAGAQGIYFHGTADYAPGNSAGKNQIYTPVTTSGTPAPEFYGMLFAAQMTAAGGSTVGVTAAGTPAMDAFAVAGADGNLRLALVNRSATPYTVPVTTADPYGSASEIALAAPSPGSLSGVTLGGTAVAGDGTWAPVPQPVAVAGTASVITVPADTGVIVTYVPASSWRLSAAARRSSDE